ncbi:hypothetical protein OAA06_00170 [bacterium]|nr:hypothetical protein [bacterium]
MKAYLSLLLLLGIVLSIKAQTKQEKAYELKNEAIHLMDSGLIHNAIALLDSAQRLDPENIMILYEKALAFQLEKNFDKSIDLAKLLLKHANAFDQVYQLLGDSYGLLGDKGKALKTYEKGIKKFPKSGLLYLEKGMVLASQKKLNEALSSWEKGIVMAPSYSSNYYYASKMLSTSNEKIWSIYYGELFMNLEPNSERSKIISKLMYDTYQTCLPISNGNWGLAFSTKANYISLGNLKNLKFSFETVHNLSLEAGLTDIDTVFTIQNLVLIRKQFLRDWKSHYAIRYPNLIFDYHDYLTRSNQMETYLFWLMQYGAPKEFEQWKLSHKKVYKSFLSWRRNNSMSFSDSRKINRFSYD